MAKAEDDLCFAGLEGDWGSLADGFSEKFSVSIGVDGAILLVGVNEADGFLVSKVIVGGFEGRGATMEFASGKPTTGGEFAPDNAVEDVPIDRLEGEGSAAFLSEGVELEEDLEAALGEICLDWFCEESAAF